MKEKDWEALHKKVQEQLEKNKELISKIDKERAEVFNRIIQTWTRRPNKESIKSCICCDYWKVDENEKHRLIGYCTKGEGDKTDYGFVCKDWKKINKE